MSTHNQEVVMNQAVPADAPQPAPATGLPAEEVVNGLRVLRAQIGEVTPLTSAQRKLLRNQARTTNPILQASINAMGALDNVAQALGLPAADVRRLYEEANRWTAVEDELRTLLNGVAGANLVRRHRIALITTQAASISSQLARDPAHAVLVPHVAELKRLKSFSRRNKKAAPEPTPAPGTPGGERGVE